MPETWVTDSSPVITLTKAGLLFLLETVDVTVILPETVVAEILAGTDTDPARLALENGWGTRLPDVPIPTNLTAYVLDPGETAVLALALHQGNATAVIDDSKARRVADHLNIPRIGTMGIVLRARRLGQIDSASKALRALKNVGLYLPDNIIREALAQFGETWE